MQGRLRILIVIAFIIIIVAVILVVVLQGTGGGNGTATPRPTTTGDTTANATPEPDAVPTQEPIPMVRLVVAVQPIARGMVIPPGAVDYREWPESAAPQQLMNDIELVEGKVARVDILQEQPVLFNMLAESPTGIVNAGGDVAAVLPNNRVAVAVPIDRITSVAYAIQPGDRVDVMVSLLFVDVDEEFQAREPNSFIPYNVTINEEDNTVTYTPSGEAIPGNFETRPGAFGDIIVGITTPSEKQRPRLVTQRTVQDALVIWLGDVPRDGKIFSLPASPTPPPTDTPVPSGGASRSSNQPPTAIPPTPVPPRPDIIVLGVSPQDAVVLTWFIEARLPITFAVRSATTTSQVLTEDVSLDYIMDTFNIEVPGKRPYAIEPAITSIRELIAGNRIQLDN